MKLNDLLALSYVPRWGIVPMLRQQTVSDHVFRTVTIFAELANRVHIPITAMDLLLILWHDGPESQSGDIPAPFKHRIADVVAATEREFCNWYDPPSPDAFSDPRIFELYHVADLIEQYTWLVAWGHGPLAKRVMRLICIKVDDAGKRMNRITGAGEHAMWTLIADINDEQGRYGGREEASR